MSNPREIGADIEVTPEKDDWIIKVWCPHGRPITAQEIIDVISEILISEGELDWSPKRDLSEFDS